MTGNAASNEVRQPPERVQSTISLVCEGIVFRGQVEILRRPLHRNNLLLRVGEAAQALSLIRDGGRGARSETNAKTVATAKHVASGYLDRQPFSICVMGKAYVTASPSCKQQLSKPYASAESDDAPIRG